MKRATHNGSPLDKEVRFVKGVGPKRADLFRKLDIVTVGELLLHLPRDYEDRRHPRPIAGLRAGDTAVIRGTIEDVGFRRTRSPRLGMLHVDLRDDTGLLRLMWFNAGPGWQKSFPVGKSLTAYGRVDFYGGLQMVAPDYEIGTRPDGSGKFGRILPVYPLTEGVSQKVLRKIMLAAVEQGAGAAPEVLPQSVLRRHKLPGIAGALWSVHFPSSDAEARAARRRLAYEELLAFQIALALRRAATRRLRGVAFRVGPNVDRRIRRIFAFEFTAAQNRAIEEVCADMRAPRPMNRLLQGDVGCGKTVVAVYAMLAALAESSKGRQVALMAPTEILAEQHYLTLRSLLEKARVRHALLTGSVPARKRDEQLADLTAGRIDLVIGTHALIQGGVRFSSLALAVVDEQHRFGVRQRLLLRRKGPPPDVLIMTATPIPRTLALTCFADMDVSIIEEMPPGRKAVSTELYPPARWPEAFEAARDDLREGRGVFVIYPLVEENRDLDLTSATEGYDMMRRDVFPEYPCCLLHGQMPPAQKQKAMEGFRAGRYQVMVATTVVEVGIDVPQATVMIVQHAERLGLAQLHQLRGRIGRGGHAGRCFLLADPTTEEASARLAVLAESSDGFRIAEEDLRIRGPGQVFGTRQSGMPEFRCYDFSDMELLRLARDDAFALVERDPALGRPEHRLLRTRVREEYGDRFDLAGAG